MLIQNRNLLHENAPKTFLMNTEVAGTTIFRLRNTSGFGSSWAVQIGEVGEEQTEVLILSGNPPAIGTLGTTTASSTFEHPADTPVYGIKYNQVVFQRSTSGTAGTATALTDGTITYQPAFWDKDTQKSFTIFDDTSGSVSYAYRTLFRNSVLSAETTQSDWIVITPNFYSLAVVRERTKEKLWNSDFLLDATIDNWTNEFKDKLTNIAIQTNEDYALGTVDVAFDGSNGYGTVVTGDFKQPRRIDITYNGNDWFMSTKMESNDYFQDQQFSSVHPYHTWIGNTVFRVRPDESGGTARITFYRLGTTLVNDTDELPLYQRGYTDGFVEYNLIQAQYKDQKITLAEKKQAEAILTGEFTSQLAPRDKTGPTMVKVVEPTSSWDGY